MNTSAQPLSPVRHVTHGPNGFLSSHQTIGKDTHVRAGGNMRTRPGGLRRTIALAFASLALCLQATTVVAQDVVKDLRGADVSAPDTTASGTFRPQPDGQGIPRNYVQQPPMVPHKIDGYEVSLNFNRCMDCHSWSRYREMGATKVSLTHFKDRDGGELANISPRRYFCVQCHVPQTDARPLVENQFQRSDALR